MNTARLQRLAVEVIRTQFPDLEAGIEFSTRLENLLDEWHAKAAESEYVHDSLETLSEALNKATGAA